MTSQVNPNNIDGTFPIAGQDNDSQGFRDNFTNTKNNFQFIFDEITDLQSKAVVKSALTGTSINNDFAGSEIINATLKSFGERVYPSSDPYVALSGAQAISYANGNFQKIQLGGSIVFSFSNWPAFGVAGRMILQINVPNVAYTVTFPSQTTLGFPDTLAGSNSLVVTYPQTGDYFYEIISTDNGASFFTRELGRPANTVQGSLTVTGNVVANVTGDIFSASGVKVLDNGTTGLDATFAGTVTGNVVMSGTKIESGYQYYAATDNFNITVNNNVSRLILDPAAGLINGTITLPSANVDATVVTISSTQAITNFQIKPNTGCTLVPSANVTQTGGQGATFFFHNSEKKWYKVG